MGEKETPSAPYTTQLGASLILISLLDHPVYSVPRASGSSCSAFDVHRFHGAF